jgi:feruloyl esterase
MMSARFWSVRSIGVALALGVASLMPAAQGQAAESAEARCVGLRNLQIDAGFVTSARVNRGDKGLPAYCQVRAIALPAISIEVRLPLIGWNGKLYQVGCGGFCGILARGDKSKGFINAMGPGLKKGYATAASDSGHHGMSVVDASWADHNPVGERDWGWRSIGETNRVAKALIAAFYNGKPSRAYFQGCSTGGRMAHMASLKYPTMFTGIISGAPAMDYTGLVATSMAWLVQANTDAQGKAILKPGKDKLIGDEVMRQCDAVDGKRDGVIQDPRKCKVDLAKLQCKAGADSAKCLTTAELGVVAKWRQGARDSKGKALFAGQIPEGSERFWWLWLTGKKGGGGKLIPIFGQNFLAYMAFADDPGPSFTAAKFNFDTDPPKLKAMAKVYNSDNPDISKFRKAGGKMIVWHGWADAIVPPYKTLQWYEQVQAKMGGAEKTKAFVRLFMIPGMDHCGLLKGANGVNQHSIDPLSALEQWVEKGKAPQTIMK